MTYMLGQTTNISVQSLEPGHLKQINQLER